MKSIEELIELVEEDTGAADTCKDHADEDSVGWRGSGELPMTFGHVRRARAELEALKRIDAREQSER